MTLLLPQTVGVKINESFDNKNKRCFNLSATGNIEQIISENNIKKGCVTPSKLDSFQYDQH